MKTYDVSRYPLNTEKAVRLMEAENKLTFIVSKKATKADIKKAVEDAFSVKVVSINTFVGSDGKKKAFIKLDTSTPAVDIITKFGVM